MTETQASRGSEPPRRAAPERAYLALASAFGIGFLVAVPPGAAPDETPHLSRVFVISEGHLEVPGEHTAPLGIPRSLPDLHRAVNGETWPPDVPPRTPAAMAALLRQPLAPSVRVRLHNAGTYPAVAYAPQLPGVWLGRALELAPAALVYLGRAGSLAVSIALGWLAIRVCPVRRWTLVLLATTPMALATAASVSADPLSCSAALLFVALVARSAFGREGPLARGEVCALLASALLLSLTKIGSQPLAALVLLIPAERSGGRAGQLALAASVVAAACVPSAIWLAVVRAAAPPPASPGADPAAQLQGILADPLAYLGVLATTTATQTLEWYRTFVGVLGPLAVSLPGAIYAAYAGAFALAAIGDGPPPAALTAGRRALCLAVFGACIAATLTLGYLGWNQVGAPLIRGVQGRYFIPAAPVLFLALPSARRELAPAARHALLAVAAAGGVAGIAAVLARYWTL